LIEKFIDDQTKVIGFSTNYLSSRFDSKTQVIALNAYYKELAAFVARAKKKTPELRRQFSKDDLIYPVKLFFRIETFHKKAALAIGKSAAPEKIKEFLFFLKDS
jgi:hypothetical protein